MKLPRPQLIAVILVFVCRHAALGQDVVPPPTNTVVPPGNSTVGFQDRSVKILGDVAYGPPLGPLTYSGWGTPVYSLLWGPRAYAASGKLVNFSFRGTLGAAGGEQVMMGGFVVGAGGRVVLLRAVGPTLTRLGVGSAVARPQLELFDAAGRSVARAVAWSTTSNDTQSELMAAANLVGAFQLTAGSADQVLLAHLAVGAYTCVVSNRDATGGTCLLEGYEVPNDPTLARTN